MATFVNDLRLKEIATGDESGTWGTSTNLNLELIGEALGYNTQDCFSSDADATTTVADGVSDPARAMYFKVTSSATLTATRTLTIAPNTISRVMFIENATTGSQSITISQGSGANVTISNGRTTVVYLDGAGATAAVVDALALVDPGVTDTLAEVLVAGNTSGGTSIIVSSGDDLTLTGASASAVWDSSASALEFADNAKAIFGTGDDLEIYHDASNSIINDTGTGNLQLQTGGSTKLEITSTGLSVTGTAVLPTVDINAGAIDGTIVGAATPAAGTFTTLTANTSITGTLATAAQANITSVGTLTSLAVSGDLTVDTNTLKVDSTNNRVGVLNASPAVSLDAGSATDAFHVPVGTTAQRPTGAAGHFRYNTTLEQFEGYTDDWGQIGGGGGANAFATDSYTGNGSTTAYALSQVVVSEDNLLVFIEGVFQQQDAYSIATAGGTTTLTFTAAPANGNDILIYSVVSAISGTNLNSDTMTGDGSDTTLTLSLAPVNENNTQVYIDGVYQNKDTYSISGTTLTFSTAPPNGSAVEVMTMNQLDINTPTDGSVTPAKIASGDFFFDTNTLYIDATNNRVGIGTSSPSDVLHAVGPTINLERQSNGAGFGVGVKFSLGDSASTTANHNYASIFGIIEDNTNGAEDGYLSFQTSLSGSVGERMRIDSSGNVGIGTIIPSSYGKLAVDGTASILTNNALRFYNSANNNWAFIDNPSTDATAFLRFTTGGGEAMRIDASNNLLVGTTSTSWTDTDGLRFFNGGSLISTLSGGPAAYFNRRTNDGNIVVFAKDGSTVGSIGTEGGDMFTGTGDTGLCFVDANDAIVPWNTSTNAGRDAAIDLGSPSARFANIYRSGSTISTSDRNMKQDIRDLTDAERNVAVAAKGLLKAFRFIDTVEAEGDNANIHFGIIAQDLAAAFTAEGLDANDYQVYRASTFTDDDGNEQTRLGICYENLLAFIIAAI